MTLHCQPGSFPISVVVCTYNRLMFLRRNIPCIYQQLIPEDELLVLDNNSTDGTSAYLEELAYPNLRYLFVCKQGLNVCRNVALRESTYNHIAFLDDDACPAPGWLEAFRNGLASYPAAAILAGRTELQFETVAPKHLPAKFRYLLGAVDYGPHARRLLRRESPGGGNMLVDRRQVLEVGQFDERLDRKGERLLNNGETEVATALQARGADVFYVPQAVIYHWAGNERTNKGWLFRRAYFQGVSDGLMAVKRQRFATLCMKRLAFHFTKGLMELCGCLRAPKTLLFGMLLEIAKTAGSFMARNYAE